MAAEPRDVAEKGPAQRFRAPEARALPCRAGDEPPALSSRPQASPVIGGTSTGTGRLYALRYLICISQPARRSVVAI